MTSQTTFYLSRIIGKKIYNSQLKPFGRISDLFISFSPLKASAEASLRPKVIGIKIKISGKYRYVSFSSVEVYKDNGKWKVVCKELIDINLNGKEEMLLLSETILDKQIVDLNGRKLVRVNDIRMVSVAEGTFAIAVDVGVEGLLRRIGIAKQVKFLFTLINIPIPSKFILWDDIEAVDFSNLNIKLSKQSSKLNTLHPSDLADIIEDLGKSSKTEVFSALDEETAADVLEELETQDQIHIIESLTVEKAADVLEKMPADEVADIIVELENEKAELLLNEMDMETSGEVRELLEYQSNHVGSFMSTDIIVFNEHHTVDNVLKEIRSQKPVNEALYNIFVTDNEERLIATLSLRDLVVSSPDTELKSIMQESPVSVLDTDKLDSLAEIISKYNLLAIPVTDKDDKLQGMVVIDDVIEDLINKGRTNK